MLTHKQNIIGAIALSIALYALTSLLTGSDTEAIRIERMRVMQERVNMLSGQITQLMAQYQEALACYQANSNTGTLVECPVRTIYIGTGAKTKAQSTTGNVESLGDNTTRAKSDTVLMSKICERGKINGQTTPLCNNWELYDALKNVTASRMDVSWFPILVGITYAESHIGVNFAKDNVGGTCYGRNNWGGVKWRITDTGVSVKDQGIPDQYNCWLYKFNSVEDYWISKVNTFRFRYKPCLNDKTPVRCISYAYVGDRNVAETAWIARVSYFLDN